jgi:hypothetical protein
VVFEGTSGERRSVAAVPGDQRGYYLALRDALAGRGANPVSPAQGAAVIALIEAGLRSDAEGRRIVPDLQDDERAAWPEPLH